ncbi:MAG: hypothetical protein RL094_679 [Candidatus Parcubacteria bacterium]|jgi:hypothetical protein
MILLILFLLITQVGVTFSHVVFYKMLTQAYAISPSIGSHVAFVTLIVLSFSFFISSYLTTRHYSVAGRIFYVISAVWVGLFLLFFITTCAVAILSFIAPLLHIPFSLTVASTVGYCIAALIAAYGLININTPVVRHIHVPIQNLPASWNDKKVVFFFRLTFRKYI